jgi:hypothetical protein
MNGIEERATAVLAAEAGAERWHAAVVAQRPTAPDHADFYALGCELVRTLRALEALARLLSGQVADYGLGRRLYDDTGLIDPGERLAAASASLDNLAALLAGAERQANTYWSHIGHIGRETIA